MKRIMLAFAVLASLPSSAQEAHAPSPRNRFLLNAGVGLWGGMHRIDRLDWSGITPQQTAPRQGHSFSWPSFFFEGGFALCDRMQLTAHYSHWQQEQWLREGHDVITSHWNSVNTYMVGGRFEWLPKCDLVDLYSGVMAGASFQHFASRGIEAEELPLGDATLFSYQVTAAGIRFGKAVGFVAELGYGAKGTFSTGLSVRF
ncbi:MAG: hypothetical protein IPK70_15565 [Flavobacteriales bacterium]|nr:hypothetical protein [Flavobacteriales bacterium]